MVHKKFILFLMANIFCHLSSANSLSSLPGGLLFPAFSSAGLVNAAAMSFDWRQEAKVLYSPPLSQEDSHGVLTAVGYSNHFVGLNFGFSGSYQDSSVYDSVFSGLSFRLSRLSLGTAFRKTLVQSDSPIEKDLSAVLKLSPTLRLGVVGYNLGTESQLGLGIGIGRLGKQTLSADILFPGSPRGKGIFDQYAANLSLTTYLENVGYSAGIKYSRQQDGFSNESLFSANVGTTVSISKSVNLTGFYHSNPHTVTVGFVWLWTPPAKEYIDAYKEENWNTIWGKSR